MKLIGRCLGYRTYLLTYLQTADDAHPPRTSSTSLGSNSLTHSLTESAKIAPEPEAGLCIYRRNARIRFSTINILPLKSSSPPTPYKSSREVRWGERRPARCARRPFEVLVSCTLYLRVIASLYICTSTEYCKRSSSETAAAAEP